MEPHQSNLPSFWRNLGIMAILLLAAAGIVAGAWLQQQSRPPQRLECPDLTQGCTLKTRAGSVEIRSSAHIQTLLPFDLTVKATGVRQMEASFSMVNMDMGFNRYTLKQDTAGVFQARITLPFCISGRGDWLLTLEMDDYRIEIPFTVENTVRMP